MRLWPRSLFGRLTLVLLIGFTAALSLAAWIHMHDRGQVIYETIHSEVIERTVGIVQLLDALAPAERTRLLPLLSGPQLHIILADAPQAAPPEDTQAAGAQLVYRQLRERLGQGTEIRVALEGFVMAGPMAPGLGIGMGAMAMARMHGIHTMASRFFVQVRLDDDTWVRFERQVPREVFDWPVRLSITLGALLFGVTALSLFAVRWLVRPLQALRRAADALGKDIHRPPLAETGPVEVAETSRAFNTMQGRIQRFVDDRARILAAVSHDLKTPLTRLRLRADLLDDEGLGEKIRRDLDEMQTMVDATLDFMRGAEIREETRSLDLMALLESLCDDAREAGAQIRLEGRIKRPYLGRPLALKRCIGNLLDNALRYGGAADLAVQDGDQWVGIAIADRGPGIPPEAMERVFEPFFRAEGSRGRASGGTGLGLGIARNLARAHGGDLTLKNRDGGGLLAELTLPR